MFAAAAAGFAPAFVDLIQFAWHGWYDGKGDLALAFRMFKRARQSGHRGAWMTFCALAHSGKAGITLQLCAYLLRPFAFWRYFSAVRREPFAESVLLFNRLSREPILRDAA